MTTRVERYNSVASSYKYYEFLQGLYKGDLLDMMLSKGKYKKPYFEQNVPDVDVPSVLPCLYLAVMERHISSQQINEILTTLPVRGNAEALDLYVDFYACTYLSYHPLDIDYRLILERLKSAGMGEAYRLESLEKRIAQYQSYKPAMEAFFDHATAGYTGPRYRPCKVLEGALTSLQGRLYLAAHDFSYLQEIDACGEVVRELFRERAEDPVFQLRVVADYYLVSYVGGRTVLYSLETMCPLLEIDACLSLLHVKEIGEQLLIYSATSLYRIHRSSFIFDVQEIAVGVQPKAVYGDRIVHVEGNELSLHQNTPSGLQELWRKKIIEEPLELSTFLSYVSIDIVNGDLIMETDGGILRIGLDGVTIWKKKYDYYRMQVYNDAIYLLSEDHYRVVDFYNGDLTDVVPYPEVSLRGIEYGKSFAPLLFTEDEIWYFLSNKNNRYASDYILVCTRENRIVYYFLPSQQFPVSKYLRSDKGIIMVDYWGGIYMYTKC